MNTQANAVAESSLESQVMAPTHIPATRRLYWSLRRELWENPSIYIAPLAVAGVALAGFLTSSFLGIWEPALRLNPEHPEPPYDLGAGLLMLTGIAVSVFYCLDALHGERRDRSILFWKSLPVSDAATVFSKASIPFVVLPLLTFAVTVAMQWIMLLWSTAIVWVSGGSVATLWTKLSFFQMSLMLLYHLVTAHALWPMPIYSWMLLVSGWARRAALLWAVLPVLVIGGLEAIFFRTSHFALLAFSHLIGDAPTVAHDSQLAIPLDPMTHITPGTFFGSPGLWIGLAVTAAFLAAAVRLRRYRGPI